MAGLLERIDAVHGAYYLVLHGWISAFGASELAVRSLSAIAIGVAVAGTYVLARQLFDSSVVPSAAALILAVLPRVTWMGLETRSFALATAAAVWMTVAFVWAGRAGGRRWWAYAALVTVGVLFHLYVALLVVVHALAIPWFVERTRERLHWSLAAAGGMLVAAPLVVTALGQRGQLTQTELSVPGFVRRAVVNQWFLGETPGGVEAGPWLPAALMLALAGWIAAGVGAIRLLRAPRPQAQTGAAMLLLGWILLPTVVIGGWSLLGGSLYHPRYFGYCAPALAMLIAMGLTTIHGRFARVALVGGLVLLVAPIYASQRMEGAKSGYDWSRVAERIAERAREGDGVYFSPSRMDDASVVRATSRPIASAYPEPFAGLVDVTRISDPADSHLLFAGSRQLAVAGSTLDGLDTIWVVRRTDLEAAARDRDEELLAEHGLTPTDAWSGPRTTLVRFDRR
ncbi:glycosyltransferase family 39 protein [Aeromicrobium senzhongii]|uniref:Glycosyltransferase family 39 protein n=1 Tax=Aeromicrobium senzhongii TaxID=2663859 RepID=A0ABX6SU99_9ACTN|nr:glycosyltransferase family 39 protein [Aeromicrobium senzhongii]QNL94983.1 glycosyltransferase family 39 protein [Aeromicrobium senzhongii]